MSDVVLERPPAKRVRRKPAEPKVVDRATAWARSVAAGAIVAGPGVRAAAARHLDDLQHAHERGFTWRPDLAADAIAFFEEVLHLNGGDYEGVPFLLLGWQAFVVGSLYGWRRADGTRRFRVAYVETGKGSGKSPLAAGIGMHGMTADGEARAEVYAAATKRDQAMILFRDAVAMFQYSPELASRLSPSGTGQNIWNLAFLRMGSFFRPISADHGQSGPRPHVALVDEFHEHPTNHIIEMLRAGFKNRRQPLLFAITNSGSDITSPCGEYHTKALAVAGGMQIDDAFFSFVCNLDEGDDPFEDESCWPKANPSLAEADLPGIEYLRQQVVEARSLPAKQALVRRLNFCQWTQADAPWLSPQIWLPAQRSYTADDLRGRRAWGGLDLSSTQDLTALSVAVEPIDDGEPWHLLSWSWLSAEGLAERERNDKVPYTTWAAQGHLLTTNGHGRAVDKLAVIRKLVEVSGLFDLQGVAYDRWRMADLMQMADSLGITLPEMVDFGQGYKDMTPAVEAFESALVGGKLVHDGNPVLTWCAANAVIAMDDAGNRKISKRKSSGRIDAVLTAVMAMGLASRTARVSIEHFLAEPLVI